MAILAISAVIALPTFALLMRDSIIGQGRELGGATVAAQYGAGAALIAVASVILGLFQSQLLIGRILDLRRMEFWLLDFVVMDQGGRRIYMAALLSLYTLTSWLVAVGIVGLVVAACVSGALLAPPSNTTILTAAATSATAAVLMEIGAWSGSYRLSTAGGQE